MENSKHAFGAALLLLAALAQTSCGPGGSSPAVLSSLVPGSGASSEALPFAWPPKRGETYPDVTLLDQHGERVALSSFKGKVILVELAGMT